MPFLYRYFTPLERDRVDNLFSYFVETRHRQGEAPDTRNFRTEWWERFPESDAELGARILEGTAHGRGWTQQGPRDIRTAYYLGDGLADMILAERRLSAEITYMGYSTSMAAIIGRASHYAVLEDRQLARPAQAVDVNYNRAIAAIMLRTVPGDQGGPRRPAYEERQLMPLRLEVETMVLGDVGDLISGVFENPYHGVVAPARAFQMGERGEGLHDFSRTLCLARCDQARRVGVPANVWAGHASMMRGFLNAMPWQ